jgi:hypothetical protein
MPLAIRTTKSEVPANEGFSENYAWKPLQIGYASWKYFLTDQGRREMVR